MKIAILSALTILISGTAQAEGIYIEGSVFSLRSQDGKSATSTSGLYSSGTQKNISFGADTNVSIAVGYQFSNWLRADLSYSQFASNLSWQGSFPGFSDTNFTGKTQSRALMTNLHLHGKGINPDLFKTIDPFVTIGVGFSQNKISNTIEASQNSGDTLGNIADGSSTRVVYKLGIGAGYAVTPHWTLACSADMIYLGRFQTGNTRTTPGGAITPIGNWQVDRKPSLMLSIDTRYSF